MSLAEAELSEEFYETLAEFCKSHANPKRLRILHLLMAGEKSVGELCQLTGLSQPTISQHLSFMRKTGVVRARREGNAVFYSLADKRVAQACSILSQIVAERIKASR